MQYNFEWDPGKAGANARKHGVSFEQAAEVFLDPLQLATFDGENSEVEERLVKRRMETRWSWSTPLRSSKIAPQSALSRLAKPPNTSNVTTRKSDEGRV